MPALFSRTADRVLRGTLVCLALVALAAPLALMGWVRMPYQRAVSEHVEQPVAFDHRHHVVDDGIDCRYCHASVEHSASAGIPASSVCMGCHAQVLNDSPMLEPVRVSVAEGRPIPWRRVTRLPDFVFFDHAPHVASGVTCATCHGQVERMPSVRVVRAMTMRWCWQCHERGAAPTDCTTCHR